MACFLVKGQGLEIRYDKNRDLSVYNTFEVGESDVVTPSDKRKINEKELKLIVTTILERELTEKGLQKVDTGGDLVATFIIGELDRSVIQDLGPLGGTPGSGQDRSSIEDIRESNLVITLYDKSKNLIWKVSGTGRSDNNPQQFIDEIISKGFRKFSLTPPKEKKKR